VPRRPTRIDSPPVHQTFQFEVGCGDFLVRQNALPLAAARAVPCMPPERFVGLELFLISNAADEVHDGWLRLSGHSKLDSIDFLEIRSTRIRRWFRKATFQVTLTAWLPPGSLNDVIGLIKDGSGLEEWQKQRDDRMAMQLFATEIGQPVISHPPGSRLVME
jgi:hypothetical protein